MKFTYFFLFALVLLILSSSSFKSQSKKENFQKYPLSDYNVYAVPLPKKLDFSGELMPLSFPDVKERMDRELLVNTYWQSNGFLLLKRAHKYFPIIEPILKSYGVPDDFKYLALIESGLQNVTSPAGAKGFWQIMKSTAKEYGLEVNARNMALITRMQTCTITPLHFQWRLIQPLVILYNLLKGLVLITSN